MIAIIDYKIGNLGSIANALNILGIPNKITNKASVIKNSKGIILPGVGNAKQGIKNLQKQNLDKLIFEELKKDKPLLGICLGMQLLFKLSEEGNTKCLGLINGNVKKFTGPVKIPQIGWNQIEYQRSKIKNQKYNQKFKNIFNNIPNKSFFYFVNSYYCNPSDKSIIAATTEYGQEFCSALIKNNIVGVQFHPEKSGENGLLFLKNFWKEIC